MTTVEWSANPAMPAGQPASDVLPPSLEARLLWRVRLRTVSTALGQALRRSRFRVTLVVVLSLLFWFGLFQLFSKGFEFLDLTIGDPIMMAQTIEAIYNVFFASLLMMLVVSSSIILYSGLYGSAEAEFLLTTPIRPQRIVLHKFQEAIVFSSWGFLLLGSPMLVAHGLRVAAPWYFFALIVPFMAAFVYIPGGLGAIVCLVFVHRVSRLHHRVLWLLGAAGIGLAFVLVWSLVAPSEHNLPTPAWFQEILARLEF